MNTIDIEWDYYITTLTGGGEDLTETTENTQFNKPSKPLDIIPKCSDLYISTQTKIAYLNTPVDLNDVFWKIPIINYQDESEGIIKKQMKINNITQEEVDDMESKINATVNYIDVDIISKVNNASARKTKFKDVRKINIVII